MFAGKLPDGEPPSKDLLNLGAMPLSPGTHFLYPTVPVYVFEASEAGPTAVIQAGIHGDEVAGVHAVEEMLEEEIRPDRGRLLLIPRMNPAAYRARRRAAPEESPGWAGLDLNRCFPGDPESMERERRLARVLMSLVEDEQPALVATLHESDKRYDPAVSPSFGQSLVYGVDPVPPVISQVVRRLNETKRNEDETWSSQYYPVSTSSTEVIVEATGCVGVCVETWMNFDERRRIEMQREVVDLFLDELGVRSMRAVA